MQNTQQAIFLLGEDEYSLSIMDVVAIEKNVDIQPATGLPQYFKGVLNLRGDIIPVYSLRRKFGMEDVEPDIDTRFVITSSNGVLVAFEVDKMIGIVQVADNQAHSIPLILRSGDTSYLQSVIKVDKELVLVMDKDGLLTEEDQKKITKAVEK